MFHCGFGGILAVFGAVALVKALVSGFGYRRHRRLGCGPFGFARHGGCGPHGGHGHSWHGGHEREGWGEEWRESFGEGGGRHRREHRMGMLFDVLDATPEQERTLRETMRELRGSAKSVADKVAASRGQWADALEAEHFDESLVGSAVADLEHAVDDARKVAIDAFAKVHATLDADQRKRLASWLRRRRGFGGPFRGGPYRSVL